METRTFGEVFAQDLEHAKSGYTAPGGRTDGNVPSIDFDSEMRYDLKPPVFRSPRRDWAKRHHYPTTRQGRIAFSILREIERETESKVVRTRERDTSGW